MSVPDKIEWLPSLLGRLTSGKRAAPYPPNRRQCLNNFRLRD